MRLHTDHEETHNPTEEFVVVNKYSIDFVGTIQLCSFRKKFGFDVDDLLLSVVCNRSMLFSADVDVDECFGGF